MKNKNKNKKIFNALLTLCAALVLMGGFSVTAYAQTPEGQDDATDDSGVVYEEPEKEEPLTPDGNATLVDDFGGNKQLITVTTKNGNYFYIIIDRDDEGNETVHFLNQVDEADLLMLMSEEEAAKYTEPVVETTPEPTETEPEPKVTEPAPEEKPKTNMLPVVLLVVALIGGGGFFVFKKMQGKKKEKEAAKPDPDADYVDDEEDYGYVEEDDDDADFIVDDEDNEPV